MTDAKKVKVSVTNNSAGPRTFYNAEGEQVWLGRGHKFEGEVLEADRDTVLALEGEGAGTNDSSVYDFPSLDGMDRTQLLSIAADEGYTSMSADATEDQIRDAIEHGRKMNAPYMDEIVKLRKSKVGDLREIAAKEGVPVESDDNKPQLALKIAQARAASK